MRNTLLLLLLFIVLGGFTYWFIQEQPEDTSIARWDTNFAVENIDDIYKVIAIHQRSGDFRMGKLYTGI